MKIGSLFNSLNVHMALRCCRMVLESMATEGRV